MQFADDFKAVRNHYSDSPVVVGFSRNPASKDSVTPQQANFAQAFPVLGRLA